MNNHQVTKDKSTAVELCIRYFAAARERVGLSEERLYLESPLTLSDLREELLERYPQLISLDPYLRWALNQTFVNDDTLELKSGDEIALIPPISGG